MNHKQKIILKCVAAIFIVMCLFPPFHIVTMRYAVNEGYGLIFSPPKASATVDAGVLLIQLFVALVVGGIAFALSRDEGTKDKDAPH